MKRLSIAFAAAALLAGAVAPASALEIGTLRCNGGPSSGMIIGSMREYACTFYPAGGGPLQRYIATARRFGLDVGVTSGSRMAWVVVAGTRYVGPGDLEGRYFGASAAAAVGVGAGANAYIGGMQNAFTLQPLSGMVQRGVNVAGGVGSLDLRYVRPGRGGRYR